MREINFRGIVSNYERNATEKIGKWVYGGYVVDEFVEPERHIIISQGDPCICHLDNNAVIPESVGQFTGLHDKNGKEIYVGDIVKSNWHNCGGEYIGENYEIKFGKWWHSGGWEDNYGGLGFYARPTSGDEYYKDSNNRSADNIPCNSNKENYYDIEVIGNIHEEVK